MAKLKIELNDDGVRSLLKSDEMKSICEDLAAGIRDRCGAGYETKSAVGRKRVNASVFAATRKAKSENMKNNTLEKALK